MHTKNEFLKSRIDLNVNLMFFSAEAVSVQTKEVEATREWITVSSTNTLVFTVRACSDLLMYLTAVPRYPYVDGYKIELQRASDGMSVITDLGADRDSNEKSGTYLKCDEFKTFWVSWNQVIPDKNRVS